MPREGIIVILEDSAGRILMQLRTGPSYGGLWGLFGGWIEPGEARDAAALREIHEELCLTLDPSRLTYLCAYAVPGIGAIAHLYHYPLARGEFDCASSAKEPPSA